MTRVCEFMYDQVTESHCIVVLEFKLCIHSLHVDVLYIFEHLISKSVVNCEHNIWRQLKTIRHIENIHIVEWKVGFWITLVQITWVYSGEHQLSQYWWIIDFLCNLSNLIRWLNCKIINNENFKYHVGWLVNVTLCQIQDERFDSTLVREKCVHVGDSG